MHTLLLGLQKDYLKRLTPKKRSAYIWAAEPGPDKLPGDLVDPSPIIPIQVEGVYTKVFLDTGAQVTLLYRDIFEKYL